MVRSYLPYGIREGKKYNTTVEERDDGCTVVKLYQTEIAVLSKDGTITLTTGGWNTPTTFRRMNECLRHWGVNFKVGKRDFIDNKCVITVKDYTHG